MGKRGRKSVFNDDENLKKMIHMIEQEGYTYVDIAKHFNVTKKTVCVHYHKNKNRNFEEEKNIDEKHEQYEISVIKNLVDVGLAVAHGGTVHCPHCGETIKDESLLKAADFAKIADSVIKLVDNKKKNEKDNIPETTGVNKTTATSDVILSKKANETKKQKTKISDLIKTKKPTTLDDALKPSIEELRKRRDKLKGRSL